MNVSQALEYERQPFIPMFIYGDHGAMESERQKGEEALKVLETEYFTAEGDPSFDFATVRDLADRNRDLCDQIGEARLRNVTPATLSRGLSDADTCAAIGKMQKRTAASVMREIRGDRDALGVAYARKPIQGTVLGIDIEDADGSIISSRNIPVMVEPARVNPKASGIADPLKDLHDTIDEAKQIIAEASIDIGTVTTLTPAKKATSALAGTGLKRKLNLGIPRGSKIGRAHV